MSGSPGVRLLEKALEPLYGRREPERTWAPPGRDALEAIAAFRGEENGRHYWHLVTFGFSELHRKTSEDKEWSGWGIELTMRVAADRREEDPPPWALDLLQALGRFVFDTGRVPASGTTMDLGGPVAPEQDTELAALAFTRDPALPAELRGPFGKVRPLQVVGITADELAACKAWKTEAILDLFQARDPLLITDLERSSILKDPDIAAAVEEGADLEGSSQGCVFVDPVEVIARGAGAELRLAAPGAADIRRLLLGRLPWGNSFVVQGRAYQVLVLPGETPDWTFEEERLTLVLPPALAEAVARDLGPGVRASWAELPGLTVVVSGIALREA